MSTERIWLLVAVLLVIVSTLAPFEIFFSTYYLVDRIAAVFELGDSLDPAKTFGHLGSFFLVGILVAGVYEPKERGRSLMLVFIPAVVGCALLETAQFFQFGRHARAVDLLLNIIGYGAGLWMTDAWEKGRQCRRKVQAILRKRPYLECAIPATALFVWWGLGLQPAFGSLRMEFDKTSQLAMGNEVGGARPWLGELRYCGVYSRALAASDVAKVYDRLKSASAFEARSEAGLLTGYDFRKIFGRTVNPEGQIFSPKLQLNVSAGTTTRSTADGLLLQEPAMLQTAGPVPELTDRILSSGEFSVEAWIKPETKIQAGPASIVTLSNNAGLHNFILGQESDSLVFRVRNHFSKLNESDAQIKAPDLIDRTPAHFMAVYDHGVSKIYKDGRHRKTIDLREPFYYSRLSTTVMARVAFFMLTAVIIAWPMFGLFTRWMSVQSAALSAAVVTFMACSAPYIVSCMTVGGAWLPNFFCWLAASLLLIYPAGLFYVMKSPRRYEPRIC